MNEKSKKVVKNPSEQIEDTEKKVMKRKDEERNEEIQVLMIASYRETYTPESLEIMRQIIEQEKPEKIIVLKVLEKKSPTVLEENIGHGSKKEFNKKIDKEIKKQADQHAENLVAMMERFDIPTEIHMRKGERISEEIVNEFDKLEVDHVIIHEPKKGPLGKVMEGSVSENVKKGVDTKKVTLLE